MEGKEDPVAPKLDRLGPEKSEFLRYSLDLFNYGYFWEAHVYLEALWNAHNRVGSESDFLKALIKLSAAGVKLKMGEVTLAKDHFERAIELISEVIEAEGNLFLGFHLLEMKNNILRQEDKKDMELKLRPSWN